jgi:hypothetical protein
MILLLLACAPEKPEEEATTETAPPTDQHVTADPARLDFGTVPLGSYATQTVLVTNETDATVIVSTLGATSQTVAVDAPGLPLAPGASEAIEVTWTPATATALEDVMEILASGDASDQIVIPLSGAAEGPTLTASIEDADLGTVTVGCSADTTLSLTNTGNTTLTIEDVSFADDAAFSLTNTDGAALDAFPWTVEPGATHQTRVVYTPDDEHGDATLVRIASDDPFAPDVDLEIAGLGQIDGENTIEWEVHGQEPITMLVAMNAVSVLGAFSDEFEASIPTFFDVLQESGAPYRMAFFVKVDGIVDGDIQYIDESFTTEEAVDAVTGMLTEAGGDNDYLFETLATAIEENRSWLLDEDDSWGESKLNLIGINNDVEQSGSNYVTYLNEYKTYKTDPTKIMMHSIGGDVPRGCSSGSGGVADPATAWSDAAAATGGVFLSICETDWTAHMEALGAAVLGEHESFELTGEPAEASIEVFVDGVQWYDGWSYDAERTRIVFDTDTYPDTGATVRVHYLMAVECPA